MNTDYKYRMSQEQLGYIYETALSRIRANPEVAKKQEQIINNFPAFKTEKEALQKAFELMKSNNSDFQIWAKVEKSDNIFRVVNWWIVTDKWQIEMAADYIGMAQMYDTPRLNRLYADNAKIDDIIAY